MLPKGLEATLRETLATAQTELIENADLLKIDDPAERNIAKFSRDLRLLLSNVVAEGAILDIRPKDAPHVPAAVDTMFKLLMELTMAQGALALMLLDCTSERKREEFKGQILKAIMQGLWEIMSRNEDDAAQAPAPRAGEG